MASINIVNDIETTTKGTTKLSITTTGEDMPSAVFAIEVLPTSRDATCPKYRFSHICSMQELVEWPDEEDPDMCYFRTNDIEMLFDRAVDAISVLQAIKSDINQLVLQYNAVYDPELTGSTITISGTTESDTVELKRVFYLDHS